MPVLIAALGACLISLDSSVNVALPGMAAAFGASPSLLRWVIVCYVLTYALTGLAAGIVADRVGAMPVFATGVWVVAGAFAAYGVAPSFGWVLVLRVVQGVGAGLVFGTAPALVTLSLPPERHGRGLGAMSLGLGAGLSLGPLIAGVLVEMTGWRGAFVYRAPLAIALALALPLARVSTGRPPAHARGMAGADVLRWSVIKTIALAFLANCAQFSLWLLAPFYLSTALGFPARVAGVFFTLMPFGTTLASPAAGWTTDRVGPRWPMRAGLLVEMAGLLVLGGAPLSATTAAIGLGLVGLGVGLFQVPNIARMMSGFPRSQHGAAGGLAFLGRTLGSAAGAQLSGILFEASLPDRGFTGSLQWTFSISAAICLVGFALALTPDTRRGDGAGRLTGGVS